MAICKDCGRVTSTLFEGRCFDCHWRYQRKLREAEEDRLRAEKRRQEAEDKRMRESHELEEKRQREFLKEMDRQQRAAEERMVEMEKERERRADPQRWYGSEWVEHLKLHPEDAAKCRWASLNGDDVFNLLMHDPSYDVKCNLDLLSDKSWAQLFSKKDVLVKKYLATFDQKKIVRILCNLSSFATPPEWVSRIELDKLSPSDKGKILVANATWYDQIGDRFGSLENLSVDDKAVLMSYTKKFHTLPGFNDWRVYSMHQQALIVMRFPDVADRLDFSKVAAEDLVELLKEHPDLFSYRDANLAAFSRLSEKENVTILKAHPELIANPQFAGWPKYSAGSVCDVFVSLGAKFSPTQKGELFGQCWGEIDARTKHEVVDLWKQLRGLSYSSFPKEWKEFLHAFVSNLDSDKVSADELMGLIEEFPDAISSRDANPEAFEKLTEEENARILMQHPELVSQVQGWQSCSGATVQKLIERFKKALPPKQLGAVSGIYWHEIVGKVTWNKRRVKVMDLCPESDKKVFLSAFADSLSYDKLSSEELTNLLVEYPALLSHRDANLKAFGRLSEKENATILKEHPEVVLNPQFAGWSRYSKETISIFIGKLESKLSSDQWAELLKDYGSHTEIVRDVIRKRVKFSLKEWIDFLVSYEGRHGDELCDCVSSSEIAEKYYISKIVPIAVKTGCWEKLLRDYSAKEFLEFDWGKLTGSQRVVAALAIRRIVFLDRRDEICKKILDYGVDIYDLSKSTLVSYWDYWPERFDGFDPDKYEWSEFGISKESVLEAAKKASRGRVSAKMKIAADRWKMPRVGAFLKKYWMPILAVLLMLGAFNGGGFWSFLIGAGLGIYWWKNRD